MSLLADLKKIYLETDLHLQKKEMAARTENAKKAWMQKRDLNGKAYFMLMFAYFEDQVNQYCSSLVDERKATVLSAKNTRIWNAIDLENLGFMKRIGILTDKGKTNYNDVARMYEIRCEIAHGAFSNVAAIYILHEYAFFRRLLRELKP